MFNKKLSNNGFSMLIVILLAVLTLSILGGGYYFFFYSKNKSNNLTVNKTNEESSIDCSKESDVNGCESLKWLNNARKERGLSPIIKDETLCKLGKDISDSLVMGANSKQIYDTDTYLRNLLNDKKYDYITRNQDRYNSQVSFYSEELGYKEAWKATYKQGLDRFDKGCIVYSELNNKGFWRVVLFVDSGTGK
jgi:hypothetical protein